MKNYLALFILFFWNIFLFSQQTPAQKELTKRANETLELLNTDPEKAYFDAKKIEQEARKADAKQAELIVIETQCIYYRTKNDFKNLLVKARILSNKAKNYKQSAYQMIAGRFLFEAYILIDLPDKAFQELEKVKHLANDTREKNTLTIQAKANLFISYANYYMVQNDYQNQLKYIKLSGIWF